MRAPLVPVIVRVYVPALPALQVTVAIPELTTVPGLMAAQVRPEGTFSLRVTVPVNPFNPAMVIVELADCPVETPGGEDAETAKSEADCVLPAEIMVLQ